MIIERGRSFVWRDQLDRRAELSQQSLQHTLNLHDDGRAACLQESRVPAELNRVAESLLPVNEDCLAANIVFAGPKRLRIRPGRDGLIELFPPLVRTPSRFQLPHE